MAAKEEINYFYYFKCLKKGQCKRQKLKITFFALLRLAAVEGSVFVPKGK